MIQLKRWKKSDDTCIAKDNGCVCYFGYFESIIFIQVWYIALCVSTLQPMHHLMNTVCAVDLVHKETIDIDSAWGMEEI